MLEDLQQAPPAVRRAVERELIEAGCPTDVAAGLANDVTVEREDGSSVFCLFGNCVSSELDDAIELLVENVVADNVEVVDRWARGESGHAPFWTPPERGTRRGSSE